MKKIDIFILKIRKYPLNLQFFPGGLRPPDPPSLRVHGGDHPRKFFWQDSKFEENFPLERAVLKWDIFAELDKGGCIF